MDKLDKMINLARELEVLRDSVKFEDNFFKIELHETGMMSIICYSLASRVEKSYIHIRDLEGLMSSLEKFRTLLHGDDLSVSSKPSNLTYTVNITQKPSNPMRLILRSLLIKILEVVG